MPMPCKDVQGIRRLDGSTDGGVALLLNWIEKMESHSRQVSPVHSRLPVSASANVPPSLLVVARPR